MYDETVVLFAQGKLDWVNDTYKVLLATDRYVPSQATDRTRRDIGSSEVAAAGSYKPGGAILRGRSIDRTGFNTVSLSGGTVEWRDFTGEFRYAVIYQDNGAVTDDRLIAYTDLGRQQATNARVMLEYDRDGGVAEFAVEPA